MISAQPVNNTGVMPGTLAGCAIPMGVQQAASLAESARKESAAAPQPPETRGVVGPLGTKPTKSRRAAYQPLGRELRAADMPAPIGVGAAEPRESSRWTDPPATRVGGRDKQRARSAAVLAGQDHAPGRPYIKEAKMIEMDEYPQSKEPNVVLHYQACLCYGTGKIGRGRKCRSNNVLVMERQLWEKLGKPKTADGVDMARVA